MNNIIGYCFWEARKMTRIENAEIVCQCTKWKAGAIMSMCIQKPDSKVHPGSGKCKIEIRTPDTLWQV